MPPKKPKKPKYEKGYIFVDVSYLVFYRYFALKRWFSFAHKDIELKDNAFLKNKLFREKFEKTLLDTILKISKKKKVAPSNIIFTFDCHHKDIWRHKVSTSYYKSKEDDDTDLNTEYKGTRSDAHENQNFKEFEVFELVKKQLLAPFIKENNNIVLEHKQAEADDCVAVGIHFIRKKDTTTPIWIIASDTDYLQICDENTHLIDLKLKEVDKVHLVEKKITKEEYLLNKVMVGDVSDNIHPLQLVFSNFEKLEADYGIKLRKNKKNVYKVTKSVSTKFMENTKLKKELLSFMDKLSTLLKSKKSITQYEQQFSFLDLKQFVFNQTMIDFRFIPEDIHTKIENIFKKNN